MQTNPKRIIRRLTCPTVGSLTVGFTKLMRNLDRAVAELGLQVNESFEREAKLTDAIDNEKDKRMAMYDAIDRAQAIRENVAELIKEK